MTGHDSKPDLLIPETQSPSPPPRAPLSIRMGIVPWFYLYPEKPSESGRPVSDIPFSTETQILEAETRGRTPVLKC